MFHKRPVASYFLIQSELMGQTDLPLANTVAALPHPSSHSADRRTRSSRPTVCARYRRVSRKNIKYFYLCASAYSVKFKILPPRLKVCYRVISECRLPTRTPGSHQPVERQSPLGQARVPNDGWRIDALARLRKELEAAIVEGDEGPSGLIRLGENVYDSETGSLTSISGGTVLLRWQSAQVLEILIRNLSHIVHRDDLISQVWGEVSVTDDSLTQCIADIRRALSDQDRTILKTLPKRGYLLNGVPFDSSVLPTAAVTSTAEALLPLADEQQPVAAAQLDPRDVLPTLAVLPLRGIETRGHNPLGVFVSDEIISALSRSNDLSVISRLSTLNIPAPTDGRLNVRRLLDADFVVSGSARQEGAEVILSVEFADTDSQLVLWAERLSVRREDLLTDSSWIELIVSNIRNAILAQEVVKVRSRPLASLRLYSLLHGAVGLMHRLSKKDFDHARVLLAHLIDKVPASPAPRAWMARWHVLRAMQGWSGDLHQEASVAIRYAESALEIDPANTLALTSLGFVMTNLLGNLDRARSYYNTALAINPNDAQARALRGMLFAFCDKAEDGKRDAEWALHLTPRDPHRFFYLVLAAGANLSAGEYDRAVTLARESRRLNRTHVSTLRTLAAAQAGAGQMDAARRTVSDLMELQPDLSIGSWMQTSPSKAFENGRRFAELLKTAGVPQ